MSFNHTQIAADILNNTGSNMAAQTAIDHEIARYFKNNVSANLEALAADIKDKSVSDDHFKNAIAAYRVMLKRAVNKSSESKRPSLTCKNENWAFSLKDKKETSDVEKELQTAFNEVRKLPSQSNRERLNKAINAHAQVLADKIAEEAKKQIEDANAKRDEFLSLVA